VGGTSEGRGFCEQLLLPPDGKEVATAGFSDRLSTYEEVPTARELSQVGGGPARRAVFGLRAHIQRHQTVDLSPNGKGTVATGRQHNTVSVWDVPSAQWSESASGGASREPFLSLRVAADGDALLFVGSDNTVSASGTRPRKGVACCCGCSTRPSTWRSRRRPGKSPSADANMANSVRNCGDADGQGMHQRR